MIVLLVIATESILHKKYQNIEREKYSKREIRKSGKLTNLFSCFRTIAKTGGNSAYSSNLK